jgi:hypothetical protein
VIAQRSPLRSTRHRLRTCSRCLSGLNAHAQRRAPAARPPEREVRRRVASDIRRRERSASFTAAEVGKASATSGSRTTTFAPSFRSRRCYLPRTAFE